MTNREIIYIWDPLCGWCFSFSPVISRLIAEFSGNIAFEIISGGLAIGERVGPVSQKAVFIKKRLPDVERISGVKFGEKYIQLLDEGTSINDSLPPSIAFNVFKSFQPANSLKFAASIQHAHFSEGKDLNNVKTFLEIAEQFEVNKHGFMERYENPFYKDLTEEIFRMTKSWGMEKYPSLVEKQDAGIRVIQKGYATYDELKEKIITML